MQYPMSYRLARIIMTEVYNQHLHASTAHHIMSGFCSQLQDKIGNKFEQAEFISERLDDFLAYVLETKTGDPVW